MRAPPPPACALKSCRLQLRLHHQGTNILRLLIVYTTRLVALQEGGESASPRAACITVEARFIASFLWHDHNPVAGCMLREPPRFTRPLSQHDHSSDTKIATNVSYGASVRRPLTNDLLEHTFLYIFHSRNYSISIDLPPTSDSVSRYLATSRRITRCYTDLSGYYTTACISCVLMFGEDGTRGQP